MSVELHYSTLEEDYPYSVIFLLKISEIVKAIIWCNENIGFSWCYSTLDDGRTAFLFKNKDNALLFKLSWCIDV